MKKYDVTIWNLVNMRDEDEEYPELEQHNFIVSAKNEDEVMKKAHDLHFAKTRKEKWEIEICDHE